jgi:hypothetical protein
MFRWPDIFDSPVAPYIAIGLAIVVSLRLLAMFCDHWRIGNYIRRQGGELQVCRWSPLGPGWFGEKRDRIYFVVFTDGDGSQHRAYCKTSLFTGVYFTQDRIVSPRKAKRVDSQHDALVDEVARLRDENQRLREALKKQV